MLNTHSYYWPTSRPSKPLCTSRSQKTTTFTLMPGCRAKHTCESNNNRDTPAVPGYPRIFADFFLSRTRFFSGPDFLVVARREPGHHQKVWPEKKSCAAQKKICKNSAVPGYRRSVSNYRLAAEDLLQLSLPTAEQGCLTQPFLSIAGSSFVSSY